MIDADLESIRNLASYWDLAARHFKVSIEAFCRALACVSTPKPT